MLRLWIDGNHLRKMEIKISSLKYFFFKQKKLFFFIFIKISMKNSTKNSVSFQAVNKTANSSKSVPKKEQPPKEQVSNSKDNIPSLPEENKSTIPTKSLYSNSRVEKKKKEKSIEEEIMEKEISTLEKTRLNRAFEILCGKDAQKTENEYGSKEKSKTEDEKIKDSDDNTEKKFFTSKDVMRVLEKLDYKLSKHEVDLMIWVGNNQIS